MRRKFGKSFLKILKLSLGSIFSQIVVCNSKYCILVLLHAEMRYCEISKQLLSLYFRLAVFCLFEASVPELDTQPLPLTAVDCIVYTVH